ncbi:MAG: ChaN family lipoprotein, partial [Gemmataceae bacterium]
AVGYEKLTKEEQQQLGTIDFQVQPHRQHWFERLGGLHGQQEQKPEEKERAYQVMTAWDEFMADSAAKFLTDRQLRRLVILAGSGHIEKGFGIPDRAAKRAPGRKSATVTIRQGGDPGKEGKDPQADYTVYIH